MLVLIIVYHVHQVTLNKNVISVLGFIIKINLILQLSIVYT